MSTDVIRLTKKSTSERMRMLKTPTGIRATEMRLRNCSRILGLPLGLNIGLESSTRERYGYGGSIANDPPLSKYPYKLSVVDCIAASWSISVSRSLIARWEESR